MRILSPKNQAKLNALRLKELEESNGDGYALYVDQLDEELWGKFWDFVETGPGCWEWQGAISGGRYGHMWVINKNIYAHRLSYALHYGPIKEGQLVLHKCDNPKCCNPDHLFLGTHRDNMQDCVKKNRIARGSKSGRSKLTEEQVLEIKMILAEVDTYHLVRDLAKQFGVEATTIYYIRDNKTWKHVVLPSKFPSKLNKDTAEVIKVDSEDITHDKDQ